MKKIFTLFAAAVVALVSFSACDPTQVEETVVLSYEGDFNLAVGVNGGTFALTVKSSAPITVTAESRKTWLTVTTEGNTLTFVVTENNQENARKATVIVTNGVDDPLEFVVSQEGAVYQFAPESVYSYGVEDVIDLTIPCKTNYEFTISSSESWLSVSYDAEAEAVKLSAAAATEDREAEVTYQAGPYNGHFTVKQANVVTGTIDVYVTDYNASYTKENSVFFEIYGHHVTKGAVVLSTTAYLESEGEEYYQDLLRTEERFAFDAEDIEDINSEDGYFSGFIELTPGTEYFVMAWLANDSSEIFLTGTVSTEGSTPDPINASYSFDDLAEGTSYDAYIGSYSLNAVFHWYSSSRGGYVYSNPVDVEGGVNVKSVPDVTLELNDGTTQQFQALEFDGLYKNTLSTLYLASATATAKDIRFFYYPNYGFLQTYGFDEGDFTFEFDSEPGVVYGGESMVVVDNSGNGYYSLGALVAGFASDGNLTVVNIDPEFTELQLWGIDPEDGGYFGLYGLSDIIMTPAQSVSAPKHVKANGNSMIERLAIANANTPVNYMESRADRMARLVATIKSEATPMAVARMK